MHPGVSSRIAMDAACSTSGASIRGYCGHLEPNGAAEVLEEEQHGSLRDHYEHRHQTFVGLLRNPLDNLPAMTNVVTNICGGKGTSVHQRNVLGHLLAHERHF